MKTLKHNDKVTINGRKGYVGTVRGMATEYPVGSINEKYNTNPDEDEARAIENGHELYWINQECSMLCGDAGYYEAYKAKWANAINLTDGEQVQVEGDVVTVKYKGNYSDMVCFIK